MFHCDCPDLGTWLSVFRRAFLGFFNCQPSEAVIQFSLNICDRVDVLELRPATIDVSSHLCGLRMHKFDSQMNEVRDNPSSWVVSNDGELLSDRKAVWPQIHSVEIGEARQMTIVCGIQVQHHWERLLVSISDSALLVNVHSP
jgi:hypothetical protein